MLSPKMCPVRAISLDFAKTKMIQSEVTVTIIKLKVAPELSSFVRKQSHNENG